MDYVIDGSTLFTNLFAVFVRILMFLNNRGRQRDEDDDGRGRRRKRF